MKCDTKCRNGGTVIRMRHYSFIFHVSVSFISWTNNSMKSRWANPSLGKSWVKLRCCSASRYRSASGLLLLACLLACLLARFKGTGV